MQAGLWEVDLTGLGERGHPRESGVDGGVRCGDSSHSPGEASSGRVWLSSREDGGGSGEVW